MVEKADKAFGWSVEKADRAFGFVINYKYLNKLTRADPYPLPNIEETLPFLGFAYYFSIVDMTAGYWQIKMKPRDKENTALNMGSLSGKGCQWDWLIVPPFLTVRRMQFWPVFLELHARSI